MLVEGVIVVTVEQSQDEPILRARGLTKEFAVGKWRSKGKSVVHGVDSVDLDLFPGRTLALVGESGCGKTTVGRNLSRLDEPTGGAVFLGDRDVTRVRGSQLRKYRGSVQMIFQDPFASLNPIHSVGYHLTRAHRLHHPRSRDESKDIVNRLLDRVSLPPTEEFASKFPTELSGGQRQRVAIARALAASPKVLVADESVSMLDVSIRLSVLNLLADLVHVEGMAMLYITHDIASARYFADEIYVMYAGRIVESGPTERVVTTPAHPYTQLLLEAAPNPAERKRRFRVLQGEAPSLITPPSGCRFNPRCPYAIDKCRTETPTLSDVQDGQATACWLIDDTGSHLIVNSAPTNQKGGDY